MADPAFWFGKRVFLTGHTGFKGSWLSIWLQSMGAHVSGFSLAPEESPNLFSVAEVKRDIDSDLGDIRDIDALRASMSRCDPEIIIHMAAQPLVRHSYLDPVGTYATNVMGTVHVLEAARRLPRLRSIVAVTTDKCYENREWVWGYREDEPMGGRDPYSNSKGCAELVCSAYRSSFFASADDPALATARAGNVVGGGDWADDRLIPDILRSFDDRRAVRIRNPLAMRPWQHVLEPLSGYLHLAKALWEGGQQFAEGWNFGPREEDARPVQWIVERMIEHWGQGAHWEWDEDTHPHEARFLKLDISKVRERLGWAPRWSLDTTLAKIVDWHRAWRGGADMREHCLREIAEFETAPSAASQRSIDILSARV